jgi:DNA-binding NtrC family response regulator
MTSFFSPIEQQIDNRVVESSPSSQNLEELERKAIKSAIERYNGNISKAAKELGLTRRHFIDVWRNMIFSR